MLRIDGSQGEGGGQIVRTSVALATLTGRSIVIERIRAGRKKPGLKRQHLTAVRAAAAVCAGRVKGDKLGSGTLAFEPGPVTPGRYDFRVGTAGSATLVLQTVLPALMLADGPSSLSLEGGTHNAMAPPFDFLHHVYLPQIRRLGPRVDLTLHRHGFFPAGGGRFTVEVEPVESLDRFELIDRGPLRARHVWALVSRLPEAIGHRECDTVCRKLGWSQQDCSVEQVADSPGAGNVVMIRAEFANATELATGFGQRGVPAERVAAGAARQMHRYLAADAPVGPHLADQLMLPLGISAHRGVGGRFRTVGLTEHSRTHLDVLRAFLDIDVQVEQNAADDVLVTMTPASADS